MRFEDAVLEQLARTDEVEIETRSGDRVHRTVIWAVVDGGDLFVRSVRGERGRWYREALAEPAVALHVDGRRLPCRAHAAGDEDSVARCSNALAAKYRLDPALRTMLRPHTLPTTLRLEPAQPSQPAPPA